MLTDTGNLLKPSVSARWICGEESLDRVLAEPVTMEDREVCLTDMPEAAVRLGKAGLPCIFVDMGQGSDGVSGVDLILCMEDEEEKEPEEELLVKVWQRHYHLPWLIAETGRLYIRETVMEDLPFFLNMYEEEKENPDVVPLAEDAAKELESYIRYRYPFYGYGIWTLVEKKTGIVLGRAGLQEYEEQTEIAYLIGKAYRRQGYGREAAEAILEFARRELLLEDICFRTSPGNEASLRLGKSLGLTTFSSGIKNS